MDFSNLMCSKSIVYFCRTNRQAAGANNDFSHFLTDRVRVFRSGSGHALVQQQSKAQHTEH